MEHDKHRIHPSEEMHGFLSEGLLLQSHWTLPLLMPYQGTLWPLCLHSAYWLPVGCALKFHLSSVFLEAGEKFISKNLKLSLGAGTKISKVFFIIFQKKDSVKPCYKCVMLLIPERIFFLLSILYSDLISRKYLLWWVIYVALLATCKNDLLFIASPWEKIYLMDFTWREQGTESAWQRAEECDLWFFMWTFVVIETVIRIHRTWKLAFPSSKS